MLCSSDTQGSFFPTSTGLGTCFGVLLVARITTKAKRARPVLGDGNDEDSRVRGTVYNMAKEGRVEGSSDSFASLGAVVHGGRSV